MSTQSREWIEAARLLRRSGFGARGSDIDELVAAGSHRAYVEMMLASQFRRDSGVIATPMPKFTLPTPHRGDRPRTGQKARNPVTLAEERNRLTGWWLRRMVAVEYPVSEKLTFLWHDHFSTSMRKVRFASLMAAQNETIRNLCLGDFRTLAYQMLTDAAMIIWLDGHLNKASSPNENLAREFLELFTLGHGNMYTEADVREGARALTGWRIGEDGRAVVEVVRQDHSPKTVLGVTRNIDAAQFCDIVLSKSDSAAFVTSKLWRLLASDKPPTHQTLDRLIGAYGQQRDLRALTTAVLTDDDFHAEESISVVRPLDWLIGFLRCIGVRLTEPAEVQLAVYALRALGQLPFYPPDVGGWPVGQAWLTTSAASVRLRIADRFARKGNLSLVVESSLTERIDATGYLLGIGRWSDRTVKALMPLVGDPTALITAAVNTPEYLTC
jgi:uncharacterized protein (DUF1800 family)